MHSILNLYIFVLLLNLSRSKQDHEHRKYTEPDEERGA